MTEPIQSRSDAVELPNEGQLGMPEEWRELNRKYLDALVERPVVESDSNRVSSTSNSDADTNTSLPDRDSSTSIPNRSTPDPTWQEVLVSTAKSLGVQAASGILPGVGGYLVTGIISRCFGAPATVHLYQQALNEIAAVVRQEVERGFLNDYTGFVEGVRQALLAYDETQDASLLNNSLFALFTIVPRIEAHGAMAAGAFASAANLHLAALLAKSEHAAPYRRTYDRVRVEYAGKLTELNNQLKETFRTQADHQCSPCISSGIRESGSPYPNHLYVGFHFNHFGVGSSPLFTTNDLSARATQIAKDRCDAARNDTIDEVYRKLVAENVKALDSIPRFWTRRA